MATGTRSLIPGTSSLILPATLQDEADAFLEALKDSPTPLLKFKKTKFVLGDAEVKLGTEFVAYCCDWTRGWTKFLDGELVEKRIGRVAPPQCFKPPERHELGDLDKSLWAIDDDGEPQDPWSYQNYLPLECVQSGERYVFVTSSIGGRIGVEILCGKYARRLAKGLTGLPTIKLAIGTFHTKKFKDVPRPDFPAVFGEDGEPVTVLPRPVGGPVRTEEGPPELHPEDPGYDVALIR
jgi:hypothetical protein